MKLKEVLLEEKNLHLLKYAKELTNAMSQLNSEIRNGFFAGVSNELSALRVDFRPVCRILTPASALEIWNKTNQGFTCFENSLSLITNENIRVYFCIEHNYNHLWYGIFAVNMDTKAGTSSKNLLGTQRIKEIMSSKLPTIKPDDEWWMCTRYFRFEGFSIGDDDMSYLLVTRKDEAIKLFATEIREYLKAWKETIIQFNNENSKSK